MEEDPLTKDPSAKPENYSSTEGQEKEVEVEEKKPEEIPEKKKEAVSSSSNDGDKKVDFVFAIILSCLSFWLCGILFGGVAFILAVVGKYKADSGNQELAGRLKTSSVVLSVIGIVIGLAVAIAFVVIYNTKYDGNQPFHG